jgi:CRP-like cAMP-binding protein
MTKARLIKQIFDPYYEASLEIWNSFASITEEKQFDKNEIIKGENSREDYLHIIIKGSAGIFLWRDNHPVCLDLCFENEFFSDYMSFLTRHSSPLYTMAFEPITLLSVTYKNLDNLCRESFSGVQIGKVAAESLFIHKQNHQIEMLTLTAEQRYRKILEKNPDMVLRTPAKYIASYLGITPESMSRIRKTISN